MNVTRTMNPLHFEDLEPHRFEDLVRQLIHGYRNWSSLEAVGRVGSDDGIDILAREAIVSRLNESDEVEEEEIQTGEVTNVERLWIIQCKRERSITPRKATRYVEESLDQKVGVHGFILAAAADFSKKARDAFRSAVARHDISEAHLWGKAELEDMIFLPEHDHLLFAYFGISLQARRRSIRSQIAASISLKRKLAKIIPLREHSYRGVLLRDPTAVDYPFINDLAEFRKAPRWLYFEPDGHAPPEHIRFVVRHTDGWFNESSGEWAIPDIRFLLPQNHRLWGLPTDYWAQEDGEGKALRASLPEEFRVIIKIRRYLAYSRILGVDDLGDAFNEAPHLIVEWDSEWGFFEPGWFDVSAHRDGNEVRLEPDKNIPLP